MLKLKEAYLDTHQILKTDPSLLIKFFFSFSLDLIHAVPNILAGSAQVITRREEKKKEWSGG